MKVSAASLFAGAATLAVTAAVVAGIVLAGGPGGARVRKFDEEKLQDLQRLAAAVEAEHAARGELPESLDALTRAGDLRPQDLEDPATGVRYAYVRTDDASYRLCARFARASAEDTPIRWRHDRGQACFDLKARPPGRSAPKAR